MLTETSDSIQWLPIPPVFLWAELICLKNDTQTIFKRLSWFVLLQYPWSIIDKLCKSKVHSTLKTLQCDMISLICKVNLTVFPSLSNILLYFLNLSTFLVLLNRIYVLLKKLLSKWASFIDKLVILNSSKNCINCENLKKQYWSNSHSQQ